VSLLDEYGQYGDFTLDVLSDNEKVTLAVIRYGNHIISAGHAIKNPEDRFDREIGEFISAGRALQKFGRKLEKKGWGLCKHHDDVKVSKVEAKKRREEFIRDWTKQPKPFKDVG